MTYFIIPQSEGERGFHIEKNTEGGQGQREENNSRRLEELVIKDQTRLSSPEPTDIGLFSPQQGGGQILRKPTTSSYSTLTLPATRQTPHTVTKADENRQM